MESVLRRVAQSFRRIHRSRRIAALPMTSPSSRVWTSPDASIVCDIVEYTPHCHDVVVTVAGVVAVATPFIDAVEAADEAEALRRRFLG
jgi:hypothetical protein